MRSTSIFLLLLFAACGGNPTDPGGDLYNSTAFTQEPVTEAHRKPLLDTLKKRLKKRQVLVVHGGKRRTVGAGGLSKEPLQVLQGLFVASGSSSGAEADVLIEVKGKGLFPVSVRTPKRGNWEVRAGHKLARRRPMKTDEIKKKYGTGPLRERGGSRWGEASREALQAALQLMGPRERKLLVGLPLVRAPRGKDPKRGGEHQLQNCKEEMFIYDRALKARNVQFVGTPDKPHPSGAFTILHEFGHALHTRPGRRLFCEYDRRHKAINKRIKGLNDKVSRANRLAKEGKRARAEALSREINAEKRAIDKESKAVQALADRASKAVGRGPVLDAYAKVLGKKKGPTQYGRTSLKESFAESYGLYRADPEALGRVLPKVLKWFKSGGHLKALGRHGNT